MKVSVICTNYNKGEWLSDAIDSFLAQETDFPFEIILVDDCSSDQSPRIIAQYAEKYPDIIRPFYHPTNLGITKTWIEICQEARGDYIARCDGDDYWIDPKKLQKQVALLESRSDSSWSNTDFNMVEADGRLIHEHVLANRVIPFMDSYEKLLALKGMTMASTWLVETSLMLEVNQTIDTEAIDDTFNIQLELFKRTNLAFLDEATTVYRMDAESDSRTKNAKKIAHRFDRLLQTQLDYLEKYPDSDFKQVLAYLLPEHTAFEKNLALVNASKWDDQMVSIYFSRQTPLSFSEEDKLEFSFQLSDRIQLELDSDVTGIRVDLSELPSFYQFVKLINTASQEAVLPAWTNGQIIDGEFYFLQPDPQIIYDLTEKSSASFELTYQHYKQDSSQDQDDIAAHLVDKIADLNQRYQAVTQSRRWRLTTKLINAFRRN